MATKKTTTEAVAGEKTRRVSSLPAAHLELMLLDGYREKEAGRKRAALLAWVARIAGELHLVSDALLRGTEFAAALTERERLELGRAIDSAEMDLVGANPRPIPAELAKWLGSQPHPRVGTQAAEE